METSQKEELAEKWLPCAFKIAHDWAAKYGQHLRDDFRETCLWGLWKAVEKYDPARGSFPAFLRLCCKKYLCQHLEREKRNATRPARPGRRAAAAADQPDVGDFNALMSRLGIPDNARPLIRRIYWDGVQAKTIAAGLGISPQGLNYRLQTIFKEVRSRHVYTERS